MRIAVLVGSTAAHVLVLWLITEDPEGVPRPEKAVPRRPVEVIRVVPIELAVVPRARESAGETRGAGSVAHRGSRSAHVAASGRNDTGAEEPAASPSSSPSGPGSPLMHMRRADLRLDAATAERIASVAPAGPRDETRSSGRLERQPGGRAVVHDAVTTVEVGADGHVTFHDKPDAVVTVHAPFSPLLDPAFRREVRDHIAKWLEDPSEGMRYGRATDLPAHLQAVPQACDVWGSDFCVGPDAPDFEKRLRSIKAKLRGGVSGTLDLTAMVQRKVSGDPYASRKRKLLDETRDERIAMRERYRAEQDARSAELMRRNLERLWVTELDPRTRREGLFELWEECGDDDAGQRARAIVIGWIRARLPRGSEHAFTDDELAALRTRSPSSRSFAPYE